jgi:hypothetical protein
MATLEDTNPNLYLIQVMKWGRGMGYNFRLALLTLQGVRRGV